MTKSLPSLVSVGVLEKDTHGDVMLTWSYPSISPELQPILIARSRLESPSLTQFVFSKFENTWLYFFATVLHQEKAKGLAIDFDNASADEEDEVRSGPLPRVNAFTICLATKDFNPEMYSALCRVFSRTYATTGTPINILSAYLKTLTTGVCDIPQLSDGEDPSAGHFDIDDHDRRIALLATSLKDVIRMFGIESILIWTALIMKKRIVVYSESIGALLKIIRSFPLFVSHRQDWEILRPFVNVTPTELEDLRKAGVYCAGFIDDAINSHTDLYDLYIDVNSRSISIPEHAKADFRLGPFHKELATWMISNAEDPDFTNQQIVRELTARTRGFLTKLASLQVEDEDGSQYISYENLQERNLPPNMDHFCYAVAAAEGMTKGTSR